MDSDLTTQQLVHGSTASSCGPAQRAKLATQENDPDKRIFSPAFLMIFTSRLYSLGCVLALPRRLPATALDIFCWFKWSSLCFCRSVLFVLFSFSLCKQDPSRLHYGEKYLLSRNTIRENQVALPFQYLPQYRLALLAIKIRCSSFHHYQAHHSLSFIRSLRPVDRDHSLPSLKQSDPDKPEQCRIIPIPTIPTASRLHHHPSTLGSSLLPALS